MSDTPKFRPGDPALVVDKTDSRCGKVLWLAERRVGMIAGRPYWLASERAGVYPNVAVTEDSLAPVDLRRPVIPTLEERRAALRARSAELAGQPIPSDCRLDPREPEPVPMRAPPHHDGQAVTSSLGREDRGPSPLADPLRWMSIGARIEREERAIPSTLSVVEGIERWRLVDPAHRRAWTQGTGHSIEVHVTVLPSLAAHRTKFHSGDTAANVANWLDGVTGLSAAHPNVEIAATMAKNPPFRFAEDTGEIEP